MAHEFDGMVKMAVDPDNLKKIAITCRCGLRTVHTVPGEALVGGGFPILECPRCDTSYVVTGSKIMRLDENMEPVKTIEKEIVPHIKEGELPDLPVQPASKAVN